VVAPASVVWQTDPNFITTFGLIQFVKLRLEHL
jgi:hypothetical protein